MKAIANSTPSHLSEIDAMHLLRRTGFSATPAEIKEILGQPTTTVVRNIIKNASSESKKNSQDDYPEFLKEKLKPYQSLPKTTERREESNSFRAQRNIDENQFRNWWLNKMISTNNPLCEKLTFFWHNHFATEANKVNSSRSMWRQHQILRKHALGSFPQMLNEISKDPAMLIYLDGAYSTKSAPNENFSREVMELFTLGEGNYKQKDITEAARAFTGWSITRTPDLEYMYKDEWHDKGTKKILNISGNLNGDQALNIILSNPNTSKFLTKKLWKEFISNEISEEQTTEFIEASLKFENSSLDIGTCLEFLLLSNSFWDSKNRGILVKSPLDIVIGTIRQFNIQYIDQSYPRLEIEKQGLNLLSPPNVKGWPTYTGWINSSSLLARKAFISQLFRPANTIEDADIELEHKDKQTMASKQFQPAPHTRSQIIWNPQEWLKYFNAYSDRVPTEIEITKITTALLAVPPTHQIDDGTVCAAYIRALALDPAYQVK